MSDPASNQTRADAWCAKRPDGRLALGMTGWDMWSAFRRIEDSTGMNLEEINRDGWRVVPVEISEKAR